jgi:transposase
MTATVAATTATILALDLGKYKSVACVYRRDGAEAKFSTIATTRAEVQKLLAKHRPDVVAIEACAPAGWVYDLCGELGVRCRVANTASEAWKFQHAKRKTDRDDALRLAQLLAMSQLPAVAIPPKAVREDRALAAARQRLVGRRVAVQNRIRAIFANEGMPMPCGDKAWNELGLAGLAAQAKPLAECVAGEVWRGLLDLALTEYRQVVELIKAHERVLDTRGKNNPAVRLLQTIPGVGPRTAEVIVAQLADPKRFQTGRQVSAFAGLVPKQFQSGETDRKGRITRRGPGILRKLLVECAWCTLRYNAWARGVYARLTRGGVTRKKPAIVALARRLLVVCWAMLRDGKPWRHPAAATA